MHFFKLLLAAVLAHGATALPSSHLYARALNISTVPPSSDPFYTIPFDIALYPPGSIIRTRKLPNSAVFGPDAGDAYQLFYRTNSVDLRPDATVTTVIAPKAPAKGAANIVALATAEDASSIDCNPSYAYYPSEAALC